MTIQYASQVQVETLRELVIKSDIVLQQFAQGSKRGTRLDATDATSINTLLGSLNTALDAVIAAAIDSTPSAFVFVDITGAALNSVYISNTVTLAGFTDNNPVAVTVTGGLYSINGAPWTSTAGTAVLGDKLRVRVVSSGVAATAVNGALTVGGVSDTFTVTTA